MAETTIVTVQAYLHERFVAVNWTAGRGQTQVDDVFTRPTVRDEATSSDLDIHWQELT